MTETPLQKLQREAREEHDHSNAMVAFECSDVLCSKCNENIGPLIDALTKKAYLMGLESAKDALMPILEELRALQHNGKDVYPHIIRMQNILNGEDHGTEKFTESV